MIYLATNIRNLRQHAGYSLEREAELIGVSRQSITKWENGITYPGIDKILKLAHLYHLPIDDLVTKEVTFNNSNNGTSSQKIERIQLDQNAKLAIPDNIRTMFDLKPYDSVILLADKNKGMIFLKQ